MMTFTLYRLPDGRIVPVDSTAAKQASRIGFTLIGGKIVQAVKVERAGLVLPVLEAK
jgi:hypothetical protein